MTTIQKILADAKIGAAAAHKNFEVFPILDGSGPHTGYLTSTSAPSASKAGAGPNSAGRPPGAAT